MILILSAAPPSHKCDNADKENTSLKQFQSFKVEDVDLKFNVQ